MDPKVKPWLIGCGACVLVVVVLSILGAWMVWRKATALSCTAGGNRPPVVAGIVTGEGVLTKQALFADPRLGDVTDIVVGELDEAAGPEIAVVSVKGAVFLDTTGAELTSVAFASRTSHVDIVDVEGDGVYEFIDRGSWAIPCSLIDHTGNEVWSYQGPGMGVDDMAAGDIDGDGELEFVVGFNGCGGVHLLEADGKAVWKKPDGNVWHVEMVDTDGDGHLEILHSNAAGEMKVRNRQGATISAVKPRGYFSQFSLCRWPDRTGPQCALMTARNRVAIVDFGGKSLARMKAPDADGLDDAWGTPVKLSADPGDWFAVVLDCGANRGSRLYVYKPDGSLAYQEGIAEACQAIAALPQTNSSVETLLVGGHNRVWEYSVAAAGP